MLCCLLVYILNYKKTIYIKNFLLSCRQVIKLNFPEKYNTEIFVNFLSIDLCLKICLYYKHKSLKDCKLSDSLKKSQKYEQRKYKQFS